MIEKFTKEELAIIMKEIKELPKDYEKRSSCETAFNRLRSSYQNENLSGAPHSYDITQAILILCDAFMGNFVKIPQNGKRYNGDYCRAGYINKEFADEYVQMVNELVDVLVKHSRKFEED